MASPTGLPPGQAPAFETISSSNQSGVAIMSTAVGFSFVLVSLGIRVYVRSEFSGSFVIDDIVITIATLFSALQSTTVFVEISKGFGKTIKDISPVHLIDVQKGSYTADILFIITLYLTKCSAAILLIRLTPNKRHILATRIVLGITTVWAVISIFIIALRCDLSRPWIYINAKCPNLFLRWQIIGAVDIITEVGLFAIAVYILQGLQMSVLNRSKVALAFAFRFPVIVAIAFRLHTLHRQINDSNPTLHGVLPLVWTQIEMNYGIIAATIPCLRPFMNATSTHYGGTVVASPHGTAALSTAGRTSKNRSGNNSGNYYDLTKFSKKAKLSQLSQSDTSHDTRTNATKESMRPAAAAGPVEVDQFGATGNTVADCWGNDERSLRSDSSEQMIIRRDVEWTVKREQPV